MSTEPVASVGLPLAGEPTIGPPPTPPRKRRLAPAWRAAVGWWKGATSAPLRDGIARTLWTLAQAGGGYVTTRLLGIPPVLTFPIAGALSTIKSLILRYVGDPDTVTTTGATT